MNKRQKKKLIKRNNHWHYKDFRNPSEELVFVTNDTPYTADIVHRYWNRKHTKIRKVLLFTNCYSSAVITDGENTMALTDDYIIHVDLSKYGDITAKQNVRIDVNEQ